MKRLLLLIVCIASLCAPTAALADLSAKSAFVLIRKVAPGEPFQDAIGFLGHHTGEWGVDGASDLKVRRWGTPSDEWFFDVLHDTKVVRATRITWVTPGKRDQQMTFSNLTTEGKFFFGRPGKFRTLTEAEWVEMDGKLLVLLKMGAAESDGVTLLTGIRNDAKESAKYGF